VKPSETPKNETKRPWTKPLLRHWGDIRVTTAGSDIGTPEGGGTKAKDKPGPP
jgi:hypothetical protein